MRLIGDEVKNIIGYRRIPQNVGAKPRRLMDGAA
jgi:hypothetical protein